MSSVEWRKKNITQYNLSVVNSSGIPAAISAAANDCGKTPLEYIRAAITEKLESDGFLQTPCGNLPVGRLPKDIMREIEQQEAD